MQDRALWLENYRLQIQYECSCVRGSGKYLWLIFSSDLKSATHCKEADSKANRMLRLISRTIKHKSPTVSLYLCKSLVRSHLQDCCSTVCNPHYNKDKLLLKRAEHRPFTHLKSLPYEDRLSHLGLWSLEERRNRADLIEVFKMVKGLSVYHWSLFLHRANDSTTIGTQLETNEEELLQRYTPLLKLISRPAEGRRLSWPGWLSEILRWFPAQKR